MLAEILPQVQHPTHRETLIVTLDDVYSAEIVCREFYERFPEGLCFSDDEALLINPLILPLRATREYLGRTTAAVLLDIRSGFPLDYFLSIAATISAGGILLLLREGPLGMAESARFHSEMIPTPFFHDYLDQLFSQYCYQWQAGALSVPLKMKDDINEPSHETGYLMPALKDCLDFEGASAEQQAIFTSFIYEDEGIYSLFAPRGTGKSWLGAHLIRHNPASTILTAPNKGAIEQYQSIEGVNFKAPDLLFLTIKETDLQPETLIIEEAAKMPLAHLERLCRRFKKVLMISSVENYEGTGQGLREKIHDLVKVRQAYQLTGLKRFTADDPLKALCDALMLKSQIEDEPLVGEISAMPEGLKPQLMDLSEICLNYYNDANISELRQDLPRITALYHLLNKTHYQTNIQDLRRLFDGEKQVIVLAYYQQTLIGAIWAMEEGGLPEDLIEAVFRGLRRPKGNLVAQMLTSQSYFPEAMRDRSVRISRISVEEAYRREGIGALMVRFLEEKQRGQSDFISVSFGLTPSLLAFWEALHYEMVHLGFHLDKTTGLHSAVVIRPLSQNVPWIMESVRKFQADCYLNLTCRDYKPAVMTILSEKSLKDSFDYRDAAVIEAFEDFKRGKHTILTAKLRKNGK